MDFWYSRKYQLLHCLASGEILDFYQNNKVVYNYFKKNFVPGSHNPSITTETT